MTEQSKTPKEQLREEEIPEKKFREMIAKVI